MDGTCSMKGSTVLLEAQRNKLGDLSIYERLILKWITDKQAVQMCELVQWQASVNTVMFP